MIKIENVVVEGWDAAIRGMRNPLNSWDKSDSDGCVGPNDHDLMMRLCRAGTEHRKFMRMINVTCDVTCHHFWWAEADTYKVGTVRNSCSKMHKIHVKPFEVGDFSHEGIDEVGDIAVFCLENTLVALEELRKKFNETGEKRYWRALLELLPMGFNIKATVQVNYEVLANVYRQRRDHKVDEWRTLCKEIEKLQYSELITLEDN